MKKIAIFWGVICFLSSSCSQHNQNQADNSSKKDSIVSDNTVQAQQEVTNINNVLVHYWDNFNFQNDSLATSAPYGEQHFVDFINLFPAASKESIAEAINVLIQKSSIKAHTRKYFEELLKRYLYDVNSPFYNENFYTIALETLIHSNHIPEDSKTKYEVLLKIANKNKIGDKAADFTFYTNGKTTKLYDLKKQYVVLFFYEPTCNSCKEAIRLLESNAQFNSILQEKATLLAIYPDGDKNIWTQHASNIPSTWINGIDLDKKILKNGLYDLKASPTIYLLDKDKKVLLKDTDVAQLLNFFQRTNS